jgi:hypothetical protein
MKTNLLFLAATLAAAPCLWLPARPADAAPDPAPATSAPSVAVFRGKADPSPLSWADTPANLAALRTKPSQYGPFRADPAEGIPRHAYSPFDKLNQPPPYQPAVGRDFLPGRLVVKLKPPGLVSSKMTSAVPDTAALQQKFAAYGVTEVSRIFPNSQPPVQSQAAVGQITTTPPQPDLTRWFRASCPTNLDVQQLVQQLAKDPDVDVAEPDYLRRPAGYIPHGEADPLFASQWHLAAAKVPEAWAYLDSQELSPGGNHDIVVAVIDTGVDYSHPDLAANMWVNSREIPGNGVDDDGNGFVDDVHGCAVVSDLRSHSGDPMDDHGHGTHVAGIIGAQAGNSNGVVGVAYNCQIMAIKAAQYSGVLSTSDIAEAINYAVEQGADIINMSFGGYAKSQVEEDSLAVAFGQCVLVAAAGNDNLGNERYPMYPAAYNWVLGVMASQPGGTLALFSNYDVTPHNTKEYELMAPGVDVWSALPNSQYAAWDGTSMAAPIVSGMAVLARTKFSDRDLYSSRFIMGQIAGRKEPMQNLADAYVALTTSPRPELHYLQHWLFDTTNQAAINDNDGIVDAGETVDLAIVIRNHWGKADDVEVKLEAWAEGAFQPDPYVTFAISNVSYGAIGSFNWDDNGLVYTNQVIIGVSHPFRFRVSPDCPNDHVIPFRVTMTCRNGLAASDPAQYTTTNRFTLLVQRGRELPPVISQDLVLDSSSLWIVPRPVLVTTGATMRVMPGTQIQFGTPQPDAAYSDSFRPQVVVDGHLEVEGSATDPVELWPLASLLQVARRVALIKRGDGLVSVSYADVMDPYVYSLNSKQNWDHVRLSQSVNSAPAVTMELGAELSHSIFRKMQFAWGGDGSHEQLMSTGTNLFEECGVIGDRIRGLEASEYCAFLGNTHQGGWGLTRLTLMMMPGTRFHNNAILNRWVDPVPAHWLSLEGWPGSFGEAFATSNYWSSASDHMIENAILDYEDDFERTQIIWKPTLSEPPINCYPFIVRVSLATESGTNISVVGAEPVTFTVTFNRDMSTNAQPQVSFGPDMPMTDYTVHAVNGGWQDPRTWVGRFNITPITGNGYQLIRVAGAVAADDPWLVTGDDAGRFRFEIITSGTESMNLQATGGEGKVDLSWMQSDFDLLAGYNLYRSTNPSNSFARLNSAIIPSQIKTWSDKGITPGQRYYYKFTVVKSDMSESDFSNVAQGTPLDTTPPVLTHMPVTSAPPGMPLTLFADATDNVGVQSVTLYFRTIGTTNYTARTMTHTTGNRYAATIEGTRVISPGVEYYIEATDGISTVRSGRPEYPWLVIVVDRPVINVVAPDHGPASGGTFVTIAGSNFKTNAAVTFGGIPAGSVTVVSASQITCVTAPHFPAVVDVVVTNADTQSGTLLRGYTYQSEVASLSFPNTGGRRYGIVQVPINAANIQGLAAASLTATFDPSVLRGLTAHAGSLTPGWYLVAGTDTAGQLRLSMASSGSTSTGSGVLAYLEFEVLGSPGATCPLILTGVSLNDGAIQTEVAVGSFAVNVVYDVSGVVTYWNTGTGVPGVLCSLNGDRLYTGTSGSNGLFAVAGAETGSYTLTPSKSDNTGGVTAYDAALVLQHDAGLITLTGHAATAADVNKSGAITAFDAFYILQKAVDLIPLPFPGAGQVWAFDPATRSYSGLSANQLNQNFTAILLGDVSGNWTPPVQSKALLGSGGSVSPKGGQTPVTLALRSVTTRSNGTEVWLLARALDWAVYGLDLELTNHSGQGLTALRTGAFAKTMAMASNTNTSGQVRVAMAGALPVEGIGALLVMTLPADQSNAVMLVSASINEGAVPVIIDQTGNSFDQDTDGDGQTDWAEIRAGTNPTDKHSYFALRSVTIDPDGARQLSWSAVPGKTYQVLFLEGSIAGPWQPLGSSLTATNDVASLTDNAPVAAYGRLYRVQSVE